MRDIPDGSVDAIITDLPYGTTACSWDTVIPFEHLWEQYKRVIKKNGAVVLFGSQPFTTDLIMSNRKWFRYEIIWEKEQGVNPLLANKQPLKIHENICIFYSSSPTFNPQKSVGAAYTITRDKKKRVQAVTDHEFTETTTKNLGERNPTTIIFANREVSNHPTQKPVPLLEYLIRTYTNEGEMVLDSCMGSGTTGVACVHTKRNFIGIEKDEIYFKIASERINNAQLPLL